MLLELFHKLSDTSRHALLAPTLSPRFGGRGDGGEGSHGCRFAALGIIFSLLLAGMTMADEPSAIRGEVKLTEEALRIHREALLIDGHNDLPYQYREHNDLSFSNIDIARPQAKLHTDIPRLRKGGVGA